MRHNRIKILCDSDGVLAKWQKVKLEEVLKKGYFKTVPPMLRMIRTIRMLEAKDVIDVYIVSCSPNADTTVDKQFWFDEWLPEIPRERRIFIPFGENKCDFLKDMEIRVGDVALDDYTPNLNAYRRDIPQLTPIKVLNGINDTHRSWVGPRISADDLPEKNVARIMQLIYEGTLITA